uniref:Auxin efflux carrier n=1 Tax=Eubacterium plexicaudatum ASF492 TaxID=1235802 RepID=N2ACP6_9FIRM
MTFFTVFFQMLALLIMIGAGYFATKKGMLDEHTNNQMSNMIVTIFNPMLVLASAADSVGQISLDAMKLAGGIAVGMFLVFILAGMVLSPFFEKDGKQRKIFQLMFVFSNVGFIGIPVISSIFGPEYVVYVSEFMLVYTLVFYTYGIALMDGKLTASSLRAMVNPGTISGLLAMMIIIFGIRVPDFLQTAVTYLGNVTSPMALIAVGFALAESDLKKIFGQMRLYIFSVVKLLILPLLMLPLLRLVVGNSDLLAVCMVMFGMPVGNMPLILGNQKGMDVTACSAAIILTTVLCVLTVPILMIFAQ